MSFHDLAGCNGAADFLHMAIGVNYSNNVKSAAWENARDAALDCVLHGSFFLCNCNSHREEEEEEEETGGEGKRRYMNKKDKR